MTNDNYNVCVCGHFRYKHSYNKETSCSAMYPNEPDCKCPKFIFDPMGIENSRRKALI